jgi:HAE1 family hydrophobic/amphiphilic exporter-1
MKLPEIAVRRPVATIMVFAAITLLGCVAFFKLNLDMLPDIEPPAVSVITPYPGASATDVESDVTKYLEDQLSTTPNLDRLESKSKDNISIVNCIFEWGTDLDVAVNDIREKIDLAKPDLEKAKDAKTPYIFKFSSSMVPVLVMTVTAKESSPDLYRIVDKQIADPLKRLAGVGAVVYIGGQERQIKVHFDRKAVEAHHLSVQQVRNVLAAENLNLPAGTVKVGRNELQIRVAGRYRDAAEIANTVIGRNGDAFIRLRDIAEVADAHEEPQEWAWSGKLPAIALVIQKQSGANTVRVIEAIKERLKTLKDEVPADIEIHQVLDNSDHIYAMINNLAEAAVVAGILVVVICILFLRRFRTSLVVTLAIPFSLIGAFIGLFAMGYTINVVSLMSLSIAVGLVVDDAIVVLENIIRHVDKGKSPKQAAVEATSEVGLAVSASTLTIVVVFAPLLLIKGIAGIIFGQLAFVMLITILASLFVSLTLTPMAASRLLRSGGERKSNRVFVWSGRVLDGIDAMYARVLEWGLHHRKLVLSVIGIIFCGSLILIPFIGTEFMPEVDSGEVEIVLEMPEGTRAETTAVATEEMIKAVNGLPETQASYALAGQTKKGFLSAVGFEEGTNIGRIGGRLIAKEKRHRSAKELAAKLREQVMKLPGVERYSTSAVSAIQKVMLGGGRPISIEILGHDIEMTDEVAEKIRHIVETTSGAVDVSVSRKKPRPEVQIRLDRDRAATLGLNVALLADALRTNYYGFKDSKFREAGDDFDIELRLKKEQRESIREIGETPLTTLTGQTVKLRSVASIQETSGPVEIERKNRQRVTKVLAGVQGRVLGDVAGDIRKQMASLQLPPGVSLEWGGEVKEQEKAFRDLILLLILGVILVYIVMAGQFEDFVDPFIIMFSVPFAFVGVIWAFVLTVTPLNLMSFMGVIMLVGIVVRNAIVLVDYTKQLRGRGMGLNEAIVTGGRTRLRPVLMTSLAMIFGMVPLALSRGEGSEVWNALGITIIGGLMVGGFVTLILVPLLYSLVHRRKSAQ